MYYLHEAPVNSQIYVVDILVLFIYLKFISYNLFSKMLHTEKRGKKEGIVELLSYMIFKIKTSKNNLVRGGKDLKTNLPLLPLKPFILHFA